MKCLKTFALRRYLLAACASCAFSVFSPLCVYAQADPCRKDLPYILCSDDADCARVRREIAEKEAECRAARSRDSNSTSAPAPQPDRPAPDLNAEAREREARERERKAAEQADSEEEERARERTRAYNEQQRRERGTASSAEEGTLSNSGDERTRAFNEQKRREQQGGGGGSVSWGQDADFGGDSSGIKDEALARTARKNTEPWIYKHPPADGQKTNGCVWKSGHYTAKSWGDDQLVMDATVTAFVEGRVLTLFNASSHPFWFGRSGVINEVLEPGMKRVIWMAIYTNSKTPPTQVPLYARYCDERRKQ